MTHKQKRSSRITLVLAIAGIVTLLLAVAVGIAFLSWPQPIVLTVSSPAGMTVLCDLVIDGRPEKHRDTVPVRYEYLAESLRFAVIPESSGAGNIQVELSSQHGGGTCSARGVTGEYQGNAWGSRSSISGMTDRHIASMRAARLSSSDEGAAEGFTASDAATSAEASAVPPADSTTPTE